MNKQTAMIAMSGGVDSSVAAYLMQQSGFDCAGAMMHLHPYSSEDAGADNVEDARNVAGKLDYRLSCEYSDIDTLFSEELRIYHQ